MLQGHHEAKGPGGMVETQDFKKEHQQPHACVLC